MPVLEQTIVRPSAARRVLAMCASGYVRAFLLGALIGVVSVLLWLVS